MSLLTVSCFLFPVSSFSRYFVLKHYIAYYLKRLKAHYPPSTQDGHILQYGKLGLGVASHSVMLGLCKIMMHTHVTCRFLAAVLISYCQISWRGDFAKVVNDKCCDYWIEVNARQSWSSVISFFSLGDKNCCWKNKLWTVFVFTYNLFLGIFEVCTSYCRWAFYYLGRFNFLVRLKLREHKYICCIQLSSCPQYGTMEYSIFISLYHRMCSTKFICGYR